MRRHEKTDSSDASDSDRSSGDGEASDIEPGEEGDAIVYPPSTFDESVYMAVVASMIADFHFFATRDKGFCLKFCRLLVVLSILFVVMALQLFLAYMTKHLVSPQNVHDIRGSYGDYEKAMYTDANNVSHTFTTVNGYDRGVEGYFNIGNFENLDGDFKNKICQVPLSQPVFLFTILLIWSLTVLSDVRIACFWALKLVCETPTVYSMGAAIGESSEAYVRNVVGLTIFMKLFILFVITIPRILLDFFMLWIGCRWLTATVGFGDLLLNAVALEFILLLNQLFFRSVIPTRLQIMTTTMTLEHQGPPSKPGVFNHVAMFAVLIICIVWVFLYMGFAQHVLPDYQWDIHEPCVPYLRDQLGSVEVR